MRNRAVVKNWFSICIEVVFNLSITRVNFAVAICGDEDALVVLRRFRKRSKDIFRGEFEVSCCWKKLKFASSIIGRIIPCETLAFADYALNTCGHAG